MRICFVSPEYVTEPNFSGGLANYLGRVSVALAERGHDVHVMTRAKENGTIDYRGVTVHRVLPVWDKHFFFDHIDPLVPRQYYGVYQDIKAAWCLSRRWKQISRKEKFDLVQVANVSSVGLFFKKEKRVPVVTRLSSYRPVWDKIAGVKETKGVRARWKLEKRAIKGTRWIYGPTRYVAKFVEDDYKVKVKVVETPFFSEEPSPDPSLYNETCAGSDYALFFGRMTQMKGVHILAQALPAVLRAVPDLKMVFVGPDAKAPDGKPMSEWISAQLKTADPDGSEKLADRVMVLGSTRHDRLYPLIENARVVVLPSLVDNLPNTCLESMGVNRVVVATTGSCFEALIDDGKSGFLVEPGNPEALSKAIIRAWQLSPEERDKMGGFAHQRIAKLHPDHAIPELLDYYALVQKEFKAR
ncbi:glycosyltransferase family 1 protein [bacterium]|nr:MAG: glycosyltransferase family 1 protein [bacterium]